MRLTTTLISAEEARAQSKTVKDTQHELLAPAFMSQIERHITEAIQIGMTGTTFVWIPSADNALWLPEKVLEALEACAEVIVGLGYSAKAFIGDMSLKTQQAMLSLDVTWEEANVNTRQIELQSVSVTEQEKP